MKYNLFLTLTCLIISNRPAFCQSAMAYYQLGHEQRLKGQYTMAIDYFNQAIEMDSNFTPALEGKGYCHANLKNYEEALRAFDKAVTLGSQDPLLFLNRGWALYNVGQKAEACQNWQMCEQLGYEKVQETLEKYCRK